MRRAQVRKFLKNVGVGLEACGRTLIFRQEGDPIVDHVISENPAVGILGGLTASINRQARLAGSVENNLLLIPLPLPLRPLLRG